MLRRSRVELRCKMQDKVYRVTCMASKISVKNCVHATVFSYYSAAKFAQNNLNVLKYPKAHNKQRRLSPQPLKLVKYNVERNEKINTAQYVENVFSIG